MTRDRDWIEIPCFYEDEEYASVAKLFEERGIVFQGRLHSVGGKRSVARFSIFVDRDYAKHAADVLYRYYGYADVDLSRPYTGACEGCGFEVKGKWTCPSCGLSFRMPTGHDPLVAFINEKGGYKIP